MKRLILIDGENLLHGLRVLGGSEDKKLTRDEMLGFNLRGLLDEVLEDGEKAEIMFFGARLKKYDFTEKLKEKTEKAIKWQSHFMNDIQNQKIQFIKVGNVRAREIDPCYKCGHSEWTMIEKGVDVGLAVAMVINAKANVEIVLISSDTDLLPAVREAKKKSKIIYVGYEDRLVVSLIRNTHLTRVITKKMAQKYLKAAK